MHKRPRLKINEIFHSIQGEGTRAGQRCVFIRLTGCHLRCTYCDTEYAFFEGKWMSLDAIVDTAMQYACPFVEVTGGEPLLQPDVYALIARLLDAFETVALETSGAVSIARVDPRAVRIVDLKTPSSGEATRNCWENIELLTPRDEVKFVIGSREDYEWACDALRRHAIASRCAVLFSPVIAQPNAGELLLAKGGIDPQLLAEWMLADRVDARLSVQVHKVVWSPDARGV